MPETPQYVDRAPVNRHIERLQAKRPWLTLDAIAAAAEISPSTLSQRHRFRRMAASTSEKVLALRVTDFPTKRGLRPSDVDRRPADRHVASLRRKRPGLTYEAIAQVAGVAASTMTRTDAPGMARETSERLLAVTLEDLPPVPTRRRNHVDRGPVDEHIERLRERFPDLTANHVARLAGVAPSVITRRGVRGGMQREVAAAILAVQPRHIALSPEQTVISAERIAAHLERLLAEVPHATAWHIAKVTGVSDAGVRRVLARAYEHAKPATARALLALTTEDLRREVLWTSRARSRQQIHSLRALGYPYAEQQRLLGGIGVRMIAEQRGTDRMLRAHADAIAALYDRIGDTPGPSVAGARDAKRAGFYEPIYYDQDGVFHPEWVPGLDSDEAKRLEAATAQRQRLCVVGLVAAGWEGVAASAHVGHENTQWARRTWRDVGLPGTLEGNPAAAAALDTALEGIDIEAEHSDADEPDIDYPARWSTLRATLAATPAPRPARAEDQAEDRADAA